MITLSSAASLQLKELIRAEGVDGASLRIFAQQGGCSGVVYAMAFDSQDQPGDSVTEVDGIRFFIDSSSAEYVRDLRIDFVDSLMRRGFSIRSPDQVPCSCGGGTH